VRPSSKARSLWLAGLLVALPLALAWGCGSVNNNDDDVAGGDDDGGECGPRPDAGECPDSFWECTGGEWVFVGEGTCGSCPANAPAAGAPCDQVGVACPYPAQQTECGPPGGEVIWKCTAAGWAEADKRCTLPVECPPSLPLHGGDCTEWPNAVACTFTVETGCGQSTAYAQCLPSEPEQPTPTWNVQLTETCGQCTAVANPEACLASGCRWLEPGCGDAEPVEAGCYDSADCTPETCGEDAECVPVTTNPCWSAPCNACHAPALVCMPGMGGA
jgi:hypothetical protein